MKKNLLIGVIAIEPHKEMTSEIIRGIIAQAFECNCDIAVLASIHYLIKNDTIQRITEKEIYQLIQSKKFDGFLYDQRFFVNDKIVESVDNLLKRSGKPVMLIDGFEHRFFENTVADDSKPFEKIVEHLIEEHGCKKIYCLTGPKELSPAKERLKGYFNAMEKHGLYYDKSYYTYGDFWKDSAIKFGKEIISGEREIPDAVVCGNDVTAATLIQLLVREGIRVPENIAVTGFDCCNKDFDADSSITSYKRANFQLGADSFRRLYRIITGNTCKKISNESEGLHIGRSCGCSYSPKFRSTENRLMEMHNMFNDSMVHSNMLIEITSENTLTNVLKKVADYTYWIYKFSRFNICLTDEYINAIEKPVPGKLLFNYNQKMQLVLRRFSSGKTFCTSESFNADELLTDFTQPHKKPIAFYFSPLNYNDNFFGYATLSFGKHPLCYSDLYTLFITYLNIALEQLKVKSEMNNTINMLATSYLYNENSGLPLLPEFERIFLQRQFKDNVTFIYIEITDLKKIYCQNSIQKTPKILKAFSDNIKSCLKNNELCGHVFNESYGIITENAARAEEIFNDLKTKIQFTRSDSEFNCNLSFTVGVHTDTVYNKTEFYEMIHHAVVNTAFTYIMNKSSRSNQLFEKLCQIREKMSRHPEYSWNIDEICQELHISKSHLQKSFKSYFGASILDELIEYRISKAKQLLKETNLKVTEISRACGYSSYCYFTKQFKKKENHSPTEYRELNTD